MHPMLNLDRVTFAQDMHSHACIYAAVVIDGNELLLWQWIWQSRARGPRVSAAFSLSPDNAGHHDT